MYALSTCWNSHRHTDGRAMLLELREMGFEYAELSHGIRISLLPGIFAAVEAGEIKISSLHNFCPLPMGVNGAAPNIYQFTADSPRERESAFKHTVKTIETAARVKAPVVVLHLGSVSMKNYTRKLLDLLGRNKGDTPKYQKLATEADYKREQKKEEPMRRVYDMLQRLIPEAEAHGVKLGIENREALEEVPFESDLDFFLRELDSPTVGYWHDTGHAQIKENLGFIHHGLHLETLRDRLLGFHIHDVQFPGRDHRAPGAGMIDFAALRPHVRPEHIKVFELSPSLAEEEIRAGVTHLKGLWGEE